VLPWCEYGVITGGDDGMLSVDLRRVPLDLERFAASVHGSTLPGAARWLEQWLA
jgi:hypothetical protein